MSRKQLTLIRKLFESKGLCAAIGSLEEVSEEYYVCCYELLEPAGNLEINEEELKKVISVFPTLIRYVNNPSKRGRGSYRK